VIINFDHVSYRYPSSEEGHYAIQDINLTFRENECVAILGRTGAGKSTLCYALNGIIPKSFGGKLEGILTVCGDSTADYPTKHFVNSVGIMFQDPETQLVGMNVIEELFYGPGNFSVPRDEIYRRAEWVLDLLNMRGFEMRDPSSLSGGEKQRIALASILIMQPKILVLDEPTSEMDPVGRTEVYATLRKLRKELNQTIIFTSHDSEDIADFVDRIIVLNDGQVIMDDTPQAVFNCPEVLRTAGINPPQVVDFYSGLSKKLQKPLGDRPVCLESAIEKFKALISDGTIPEFVFQPAVHEPLPNEDDLIVNVDNISHKYPNGNLAVKNVNLKIRRGEYLAVIGQNGSGKTTLMKHFNSLLKATGGNITVAGLNVSQTKISEMSRYIGYCFQNPDHQIFNNTVSAELRYGPCNLGMTVEVVDKIENEMLEMFELKPNREVYPFYLGKGERQKVALASAIAMQVDILIIDEPTTGLDTITSQEMTKLINKFNEMGKTIIVITHDMNLVAKNIPRCVVMYKGEKLMDGPTYEILSRVDDLKKTYLKPPQINLFCRSLIEYGFSDQVMTVEEAINGMRFV
jgi:energy-coupling factor transporter ATP-binding protein EcfA2